LHEKARDNLAAIRTLKALEAENRDATDAEKSTLARYVGWGAMPNAFNSFPPAEWKAVAKEVRQHLTDEEYESARASTPNAHFTSPTVISGIWDGMQRMGLKDGAQILEPSMGVGHFFGLMPPAVVPRSNKTGVELDSVTARIAKKLYPDSAIFAKGFEETPLPDNFFDAIVGNVPFGDYGVHDPAYKKPQTRAIHDYFFAKSIDKLRPGAVMALITSRYTMDKQDSAIRRYLADRADLLGAIRLPNTAFKANAGTEVTTDILFLQKRLPGQAQSGPAWTELAAIDTPDGEIAVSEYYARHPQMMLGQMKLEGTMYRGAEPTLAGELTPALLSRAITSLPEGIYVPRDEGRGPPRPALPYISEFTGVKDGGFVERDGEFFTRNGDTFEPSNLGVSTAARVRGMLAVRDAVRLVFKTQLEDESDERITQARQLLNELYGSYVQRFGPLGSKDNIRAFAGDPDQPLLLSLENYDAETKTAKRTAIFDRRTLERYKPVNHVETAAEALTVSLNETGEIHWPRMDVLTGKTARQLQRELDNLIYQNPEGGAWETADRYLSGDVRARLAAASAAATLDSSYGRNVEALKAVQPADIPPGDISARLGSSWIPASDISDFIAETLDMTKSAIKVSHAGAIATWAVNIESYAKAIVSNTTTFGSTRFPATELIEQALNGRVPTAYDQMENGTRIINQQETIVAREKQQQLKDRFSEWVWKDEDRAGRLARDYNDRFNNLRLRTFDGSHLTFPGMAREHLRNRDLDKHQKDAVWRILQSGSTLLAHTVGAGKTYEMTAAAMELRRMGLAKKPMFVVPNHLVEQWGAAFLQLYPHANIYVAGKDSFSSGNRQKAMSRIATGNWDAVIVSHSSFEKLPVSDETFARFVGKQIDQLEEAITEARGESGDNRRIVKELEKAKKRLATRIKDRADRENKDNAVTFEQLGIDQIFVDESDLYKNLSYVSKMNRIAGLPNSESNRALDMYIKTGYLREKTGGRGVVFATGTPISNTMAEMYTTQRYLAPEMLKAAGVEHFDAWAANFGEPVTSLELAPDGSGYRMHTRFARFVNLPELLSMFRSFADVQTADMLKLPRPDIKGGKPQVIAAPASDELKAFIETLTKRAEKLRNGRVDPRVDNMLKITGEGRKAALDMRLVRPIADPHGDTKLSRAIDHIVAVWEETKPQRSTQLVFCDLSTPNPDRFNVYDELRAKLIERGVPKGEIAFIHDADTDGAKSRLFDAVNAGKVRILLGSTEKMGAGTNVQKRLKAMHELDAPWRPRDLEQRRGRIERQGNLNPEVELYRYVTEGSFDAYMWQTLETKARFIQQVMNGSTTVRAAEDLENGALTYAEIKAIASGNPAVMEKVRVDTEIRKLDQLRSAHINQQHNIRWELKNLPEKIQRSKDGLERVTADIVTRDAHADDEFAMTVGNYLYTGKGAREEAAKALTYAVLTSRDDMKLAPRAVTRGFEILSRGSAMKRFDGEQELPELFIRGKDTYRAHLNAENPTGTMQSIEHTLRALDRLASEEKDQIDRQQKALADYQAQLSRAFEHEDKLKELLVRQAQLNAALDLDKGERQIAQDSRESDANDSPTIQPTGGHHAPTVIAARRSQEHAL
jgi:N12 class adenine-specific DNA methylase